MIFPKLVLFIIFILKYDGDYDQYAVVENLDQDPDRNNLYEPVIGCSVVESVIPKQSRCVQICSTFHILCMDYVHMQCKTVIMNSKVQILVQIQTR